MEILNGVAVDLHVLNIQAGVTVSHLEAQSRSLSHSTLRSDILKLITL